MLFLDPLADLLTCLDSKILLRKKSYLERSVAIRVVIAWLLITDNFSYIFVRAPKHMRTSNLKGKKY